MGKTQSKINKKPSSIEEDDDQQQDNQEMNNAFFTCEICTEEVPLQQRFQNKQQKPCTHSFCTDCIASYIQVKIEESERPDIECPDTNCVNVLDPLSCRSFLPPKVFVRWCDYLCKSTVCERYDTGYCPNPFCSELILNECKQSLESHLFWRRWLTGNNQTVSECPHCKLLFCLRCMDLCQANHQCSTSKKVKRANEVLLMQMAAKRKWKRCPRCRIYVERTEGCEHITCRCRYEFCYRCGAKSKNIHHKCRRIRDKYQEFIATLRS
ncbi:hypothetical protein MKW92_027238 [Papaver armeniacum]|nr:hypothetical protein MKW92_027238 [Papaver armeniacum]